MRIYLIIILFACISACNSKPSNNANADTSSRQVEAQKPEISSQEALDLVQNQGFTFIDVRTPKEIADGKMEGALEINYKADDFQEKISQLDRDGKYVLYCRSGGRSGQAWTLMNELGFKNVKDATDGFSSINDALNK